MRKVFVITSALVVVVVLAQFYLAGVGAFSRPATADAWTAHRTGAVAILALALLNTVVAALARAGGRTIAFAALPIGLVILQFVLSAMSTALGGSTTDRSGLPLYLVALHAVNGLAVLGTAITGLANARRLAARAADELTTGPERAHAA
ncbi:hypothetical protein GA0070607_4753 [Micromonospora coriariae]|uniref:Uncharacterized protein n=1 Tax=Micromonospora coriariae TaxID=285665 RepID=A0A1C4X6L9_9ACTN|nr:DUF6220 domain-containing protein [Micromonospora coriariae]SCF04095.1 hypothetical protein GA0070607_4753 [Micromonospora coriariae]